MAATEVLICGICSQPFERNSLRGTKPRTCFADACQWEARKRYRDGRKAQDPEKFRAATRRSALLRLYGITPEIYDAMLKEQMGLCAICKHASMDGTRLTVDHDHDTGQVRGLLCRSCNRALGLFRDKVENLAAATTYLKTSV